MDILNININVSLSLSLNLSLAIFTKSSGIRSASDSHEYKSLRSGSILKVSDRVTLPECTKDTNTRGVESWSSLQVGEIAVYNN